MVGLMHPKAKRDLWRKTVFSVNGLRRVFTVVINVH